MSQMTESTRRLPRIPITPEEGWLSLVLVGAMAFILAASIDDAGWVVQNGLEESECADRRDERDQEKHSKDAGVPLVLRHLASSVARYGTRRDAAILNARG